MTSPKAAITKNNYPHLPAVLVLGVVSQIGQVLFLRELLMVFQGSELSIGLILAAWLAWGGVGSYLGAYLVTRFNRPLLLLKLSAAGVLLALPTTLLLMRILRRFFSGLPGSSLTLSEMATSSFLLVAPTCLLLGAQFVLLSRIWRESDQAQDTSGAGKTYVGEAAGNMLGGILFTFLMVRYLNSFQSAVLAAALMPVAILFIPQEVATRPGRFRLVLLELLVAAALAYPFLNELDGWTHKMGWQYFMPQHQLVAVHQSKHGTISVVQRDDQFSFYQSGHLVFSTAGPETTWTGLEEQEAVTFAHFAMVQHEKPERVLLIGGGLRGMLSECLKHGLDRIDYIELDEVLTQATRPYISSQTLAALADPRLRLIHTDGRLFVKSAGEKYDLIIIDVPDPATAVLNRYYTQEFFGEAQARLEADGVLIIGAVSTPDLRGTAITNRNSSLYHTLASVFPRVLMAGDHFLFYFASNTSEQISVDPALLQDRYRKRHIEAEGFSAQHYHTLLEESQLRRVNYILRNHGRSHNAHLQGPGGVPLVIDTIADQERGEGQLPPVEGSYFINSDFKPIGYYYTLMFLDDMTRTGHTETLNWLLHVQFWWLLPFFGLPLVAVSVLRVAARNNQNKSGSFLSVLFTVFTTGFSTMTLQIALLFSFQSIYGFVYEIVGLIVAIFMCGLAFGAYLTNRYIMDKANVNTLAVVQLLIGLIAGLMAFVLPNATAVQSPAILFGLFCTLTLVAGLINGVDFPLSAACFMALKGQAEKSAGSVYGVELLGACFGATLASVVVAPILGIVACCLIAGIANCSAFGTLLVSRRS